MGEEMLDEIKEHLLIKGIINKDKENKETKW